MPDDAVTALLSLTLPSGEQIEAARVPDLLAPAPGPFTDLFEQEGQIILTGGAEPVYLGDVILNIVTRGCFRAVADLSQTGEAEIEFFASDEVINLRRDGEALSLTAVYNPAVTLPFGETVVALFDAGQRFLTLAYAIWPDETEALDELRDYAETVRALLPAAGSA